jgi:hypothetical protein
MEGPKALGPVPKLNLFRTFAVVTLPYSAQAVELQLEAFDRSRVLRFSPG